MASAVKGRTSLSMGLYDTPLPPPLPPRDDSSKNENEKTIDNNNYDGDDDDTATSSTSNPRLFSFDDKGIETQDLLPSLGRRLDLGVGCYYEPTDRAVQTLAAQTNNCHPEDAAWALEACKGDRTEARIRIGVAQRKALEEMTRGDDYMDQVKSELKDLLMADEFQELKEKRLEEAKNKKNYGRGSYFEPSVKDGDWLPIENPRPIDDEPWFTG